MPKLFSYIKRDHCYCVSVTVFVYIHIYLICIYMWTFVKYLSLNKYSVKMDLTYVDRDFCKKRNAA